MSKSSSKNDFIPLSEQDNNAYANNSPNLPKQNKTTRLERFSSQLGMKRKGGNIQSAHTNKKLRQISTKSPINQMKKPRRNQYQKRKRKRIKKKSKKVAKPRKIVIQKRQKKPISKRIQMVSQLRDSQKNQVKVKSIVKKPILERIQTVSQLRDSKSQTSAKGSAKSIEQGQTIERNQTMSQLDISEENQAISPPNSEESNNSVLTIKDFPRTHLWLYNVFQKLHDRIRQLEKQLHFTKTQRSGKLFQFSSSSQVNKRYK